MLSVSELIELWMSRDAFIAAENYILVVNQVDRFMRYRTTPQGLKLLST